MSKIKDVDLKQLLKKYFGFNSFKGNQEAVIRNVLEGKDTFVIMPTGGGKSMCYQLPALMSEGTAIVVSPLIALMKNQVDMIRNFGTEDGVAHFLNSMLSRGEIATVKDDLISGKTKLLYVAPESLHKEDYVELLRTIKISFYAIDEVHCISEWGHDFRPEYRNLHAIIQHIGHKVPIIALTATATVKVQHDVQKNLNILDATVFKSSFDRANLYYEIRPKTKDVIKDIIRFIKQHPGKSGIIYCMSRKKVEILAQTLQINGIKALPYHAGLDSATRRKNQDMFLMEDVDIIVATIAFGMGIDKPDVRYVIHHDMPKSIEGYYQETGRGGRDDGEGLCIAYYCYDDMLRLKKFLKQKKIAEQEIYEQLLEETIAFSESTMCRHKLLLHYFGEEYTNDNCGSCDNCLNPKEKFEAQDLIEMILKAVVGVKELFKEPYIINILTGKSTGSICEARHDKLDVFAEGSEYDERFWSSVIRQAIVLDFISKDVENYGLLKITKKGKNFLKKPYSVMLTKDRKDEMDGDDDSIVDTGGMKASATDNELFILLKDLRKNISRKENLPPFVIFQDTSLEDMSIQYPITMDELQQITGVGAGKAKKYGQPFLDLIKNYVEENEIIRPHDMVVKSVVNKSGLKVYIIQSVDRKVPLDDLAIAKDLSMDELLTEVESIVASGTHLDIRYFVEEVVDEYHFEMIYEYFREEAETDSIQKAVSELCSDEITEEEVRLVRILFMSELGNK
ncbi:MAG: DNA helicase RecQ [Bacteroidales bacterium]|jgi:ATP-dependent DNA helicase RecQ|nr:DNA helicase RecQ [Bacteroidales bacterium]